MYKRFLPLMAEYLDETGGEDINDMLTIPVLETDYIINNKNISRGVIGLNILTDISLEHIILAANYIDGHQSVIEGVTFGESDKDLLRKVIDRIIS